MLIFIVNKILSWHLKDKNEITSISSLALKIINLRNEKIKRILRLYISYKNNRLVVGNKLSLLLNNRVKSQSTSERKKVILLKLLKVIIRPPP